MGWLRAGRPSQARRLRLQVRARPGAGGGGAERDRADPDQDPGLEATRSPPPAASRPQPAAGHLKALPVTSSR